MKLTAGAARYPDIVEGVPCIPLSSPVHLRLHSGLCCSSSALWFCDDLLGSFSSFVLELTVGDTQDSIPCLISSWRMELEVGDHGFGVKVTFHLNEEGFEALFRTASRMPRCAHSDVRDEG